MPRELRRAPRARTDLTDIWLYIGADSPDAADSVINHIYERLEQLVRHPHSGMPREDLAPGLRHLVIGRYLAFYRVTEDAIEVVRVLHGMRRPGPDDIDAH